MQLILKLLLFCFSLHGAANSEKVLICGVCKNVEPAVPNTIRSAEELGKQFADYHVIIYENNSKDRTKELFQKWASNNPHVTFISEKLSKEQLAAASNMKLVKRTEVIAYARNRVLDIAMQDAYKDYKYVVWADLDFLHPWDIEHIVETIDQPEQDWDAVLANGGYDYFALRDEEFPIGFELLGMSWWNRLDELRSRFSLDKQGPWRKVYSAFDGFGIYKRESIKGCRYWGVVTRDLEEVTVSILEKARQKKDVLFLNEYERLLSAARIVTLAEERISDRPSYPKEIGLKLQNSLGTGKVVWFSCTRKETLPWTCEHVPFHASMIVRGHDKIFINPRLRSPNLPCAEK